MGQARSFERNASGTVSHQPGPLGFGNTPSRGLAATTSGPQKALVATTSKRWSGPPGKERVGADGVRVRLGKRLGGRALLRRPRGRRRADPSSTNWIFARGGCGSPGQARSTSIGRREAPDGPAARPSEHEVDGAPVLLGCRALAALRLEQAEDLRAAAEAHERRDALPDGRRELPHAARRARRAAGPSASASGAPDRARLRGVVPVVRAAQHGDGRRAALREQLRVEQRIVALDRLEHLARVVARGRVERLAVGAERAVEAIVAAQRGQRASTAPLEELRPVCVVGDLAARREVRLRRGVRVDAEQPRAARMGRVSSARYAASSRTTGTAPAIGSPSRPVAPIMTRRSARTVRASRERDEAAAQRKDRPVRPERLARHGNKALAVLARLEHVAHGRPRHRVAAAETGTRHAGRVEARARGARDRWAADREGRRAASTAPCPARPPSGARTSRRWRRPRGSPGYAPSSLASAVAQHVARALDGLHLAKDGRPGVGPVDDEPQAARVGVHEPGAARGLRQAVAATRRGAARSRRAGTHPSSLVGGRADSTPFDPWRRTRLPVEDGGHAARRRRAEVCADQAHVHRLRERGRPRSTAPRRGGRSMPCHRARRPRGALRRPWDRSRALSSRSGVRSASRTLVRSCATTSAPAEACRALRERDGQRRREGQRSDARRAACPRRCPALLERTAPINLPESRIGSEIDALHEPPTTQTASFIPASRPGRVSSRA